MILILFIGGVLRFYQIFTLTPFFADIGWFYMAAKDAMFTGRFPILGITTSVTWLHQGPLFTYMLIPALWLFRFHPASGSVLTSFLGLITIINIFFLGRLWYGRTAGLISALLLAASPLGVIHSRLSFSTSLIPFFLSLFLLLITRRRYFMGFFILGLLFQLELATVIFWPPAILVLFARKKVSLFKLFFSFILGIIPFLIAGFSQFIGVFAWSVYHLFAHPGVSRLPVLEFYSDLIRLMLIPSLRTLSSVIFLAATAFGLFRFRQTFLWYFFSLGAILLTSTPSEAYFSLLIIPILLMIGWFFSYWPLRLIKILLVIFIISNTYFLLSRSFLLNKRYYGPSLQERNRVAGLIVGSSRLLPPMIRVYGPGNQYISYSSPYEYLVWWRSLGVHPTGQNQLFEIDETNSTFRVLQ